MTHSYLPAKIGKEFNLERALGIGLVTRVVEKENAEKNLDAYVSLYLQAGGLNSQLWEFSKIFREKQFISWRGPKLGLGRLRRYR